MMIISVRKSRTEDHNAPKPNRYVPEIMPERHIPRLLRGRGHITRSVTKLRFCARPQNHTEAPRTPRRNRRRPTHALPETPVDWHADTPHRSPCSAGRTHTLSAAPRRSPHTLRTNPPVLPGPID